MNFRQCDCGIYNPTWAHMQWHARQNRERELEIERKREKREREWEELQSLFPQKDAS